MAILHKLGVLTVDALAATESAGKLQNDIAGINKKFKLGLTNATIDEVKGWVNAAAALSAAADEKAEANS